MHVRVFVLRSRGRRLRDGREGHAGQLVIEQTLNGSSGFRIARLRVQAHLGSKAGDAMPPLYEPVLAAVGSRALLLRGFESIEGSTYLQEWRCVIESV